jgi:YVTN family beta-propeller protein
VAVLVAACSGAGPAATGQGAPSASAAATLAAPTASAAPSPLATATPVPSPTVTLPAVITLESLPGVTAITGIGQPDWISLAGASAWSPGVQPGLGRFDLATGRQQPGTAMGGVCLAMDVGFGSLWVGDCDARTLVRIDPKTGKVAATIQLDGTPDEESSVAAGEGSVWITINGPPKLVRIDPKTNKIVASMDPPASPAALRAGVGGLWLVSNADKVVRLDPTTGSVVAEIPVGGGPRFTAIGGGSVWVLNQRDGTVSRIDPTTNSVVATIPVSAQPVEGGDMAFGGGFAWARVSDSLVAQIDPATNKVVRRLGTRAGSGSVAADDDAVWISAHDVSTLWRVPLR